MYSHPKTKEERLKGVKKSANYMKLSLKLNNLHLKVADTRRDFINKVTTILTTIYGSIVMEDLNVRGMVKNHQLARSVSDVSFSVIKRQIRYKAEYNGLELLFADRFYSCSKTCSVGGTIRKNLKLSERVFRCPRCSAVMDRDYNASLNLLSLIPDKRVGTDYPEFTSVDLTALQSRFLLNGIITSKVETGKQHKL